MAGNARYRLSEERGLPRPLGRLAPRLVPSSGPTVRRPWASAGGLASLPLAQFLQSGAEGLERFQEAVTAARQRHAEQQRSAFAQGPASWGPPAGGVGAPALRVTEPPSFSGYTPPYVLPAPLSPGMRPPPAEVDLAPEPPVSVEPAPPTAPVAAYPSFPPGTGRVPYGLRAPGSLAFPDGGAALDLNTPYRASGGPGGFGSRDDHDEWLEGLGATGGL